MGVVARHLNAGARIVVRSHIATNVAQRLNTKEFMERQKMSIIRSPRPDSHFATYSNDVIRDNRLSYKARGILLELLSRPDNWRISADGLAANGIDGRDAILSGLKELRDLGYIVTTRIQDDKGRWTTESVVYDCPKLGFPKSDFPKSDNPFVIEEPRKKNLERMGDKSPQNEIKDLMKLYFDNFTGELEPSRGQLAGQLQQALKQIPYEKLEILVRKVALDGQTISRNTLVFAQSQLKPKETTPTPPKFDPAEFERPDAIPMPANFRDMVKNLSEGKISHE